MELIRGEHGRKVFNKRDVRVIGRMRHLGTTALTIGPHYFCFLAATLSSCCSTDNSGWKAYSFGKLKKEREMW